MTQMSLWKEPAMSTRFVPPTVEEVIEYVSEKGHNIDAEEFWLFYDSKDWWVGKNKMKRWKSAVALWAKRNGKKSAPTVEPWKAAYNRVKTAAQSASQYDSDAWVAAFNTLTERERHCVKLCRGFAGFREPKESLMWEFRDHWNGMGE